MLFLFDNPISSGRFSFNLFAAFNAFYKKTEKIMNIREINETKKYEDDKKRYMENR